MNNDVKPVFKYIEDKASNIDAFGGHQRTADAIWEFIKTNDGGITITLSGRGNQV